mmetsp:Transcript_5782/g.13875  ORF Transcript_5782/g.13875 Transcript_5782/m.13875 type:complete len:207 (+) Transcript_5782:505-1125(+)
MTHRRRTIPPRGHRPYQSPLPPRRWARTTPCRASTSRGWTTRSRTGAAGRRSWPSIPRSSSCTGRSGGPSTWSGRRWRCRPAWPPPCGTPRGRPSSPSSTSSAPPPTTRCSWPSTSGRTTSASSTPGPTRSGASSPTSPSASRTPPPSSRTTWTTTATRASTASTPTSPTRRRPGSSRIAPPSRRCTSSCSWPSTPSGRPSSSRRR